MTDGLSNLVALQGTSCWGVPSAEATGMMTSQPSVPLHRVADLLLLAYVVRPASRLCILILVESNGGARNTTRGTRPLLLDAHVPRGFLEYLYIGIVGRFISFVSGIGSPCGSIGAFDGCLCAMKKIL